MGAGGIAVAGNENGWKELINPNRKWYNNGRLILLNAWITLFLITSSTNGYDGSMMNGLQSLPQWTSAFNHPKGGTLGLLNAIQNIGALAAYPFAPYVSDGIGRRRAVIFGSIIMVGAVVLQTASQNVHMFIGARFLIGFGLTFAANASPLLITEIAYPPYRAPLTALYNSLWYLGAIIAAWTTFGTFKVPNSWSWRIPSALQGLPAVAQVTLAWFAPESPRWLASKGRDAEALRTLAYYHADGDETDPLVVYEFEEIKAGLDFESTVTRSVSWLSFLKTPGNRKRVRIIIALAWFSQWSGNGLVSYYLNQVFDTIGITDPTTQLLINGILQIWNLAWAVTSSFLVEKLGRRLMFLTSCGGMLTFFVMQTVCSAQFAIHAQPAAAHAVIAFIFLYYAAYDIAFTPLIVAYTVEILPYHIRAKGFNIFNFVISLALIFNQYVNPIALGKIGWKYYIVYDAWIAFEFVFCYIFVIETKNRTLEETAALFDGEEAVHQVTGHGAHAVQEESQIDEKASDEKASDSQAEVVPSLRA